MVPPRDQNFQVRGR